MTILNTLMTNTFLYWGIIMILLVIDIILTALCLKIHKREKIKKDFLEIEKQQEVLEQIEDEPVNEEIMAIFKQMEEDSKLKPEEVVKKFEDDQEQNAIISYQELLNSVNTNQIEIEENDDGEVDFVKKLETELHLDKEKDKKNYANSLDDTFIDTTSVVEEVSQNDNLEQIDDSSDSSYMDVIDELNNNKKFINSDIISPVFGRITDFTNYSLNKDNTVEVKQVAGTSPEEELKNNEAFLKALIKFRNNL